MDTSSGRAALLTPVEALRDDVFSFTVPNEVLTFVSMLAFDSPPVPKKSALADTLTERSFEKELLDPLV